MCGIVAIANRGQRPVEPDVLDAMAATLAHRGPDDAGVHLDGPIGLAHKRLSIIDLETGHQPMTEADVTVVFNGEIYNYVELKADLKSRGHTFRTTSDTEVLLHMYLEHGPELVRELIGMFAFVIHDRPRGILFAARDHFGIKPLYVHRTDSHVMFASEIKALLQHPEVRAEVDDEALQDYITFQYVLGERTLFTGIHKLQPGHYQVIDLATLSVRDVTYWEPSFRVDHDHTERYFVERLRGLIEESVRLQMRSDVPVGSYLSGGMDSSIVTLLASGHHPGPLTTFTGAFREGKDFDESEYANLVADECSARRLTIYPTEDQFVDLMPKLVYHMDEPAAGPGLFPQHLVSTLAAENVKVVLGGQGGDEVFGGYARYVVAYLEQAIKGAILQTTEEAEHIVSFRSILPNLPSLQKYLPMLSRFWERGTFESMDRRYFRLINRSEGHLEVMGDDLREAYDGESVFARFQKVFNQPYTLSYYNKMTQYDMTTGLPALLQVEDRMSMAASLESRVPLLDHRIVELVASMPPALKFKGGEMKYVLKKAMRDVLPSAILNRRDKMGFPVPLHLWAQGKAHDFFADHLISPTCRDRGLFNIEEIERLMHEEAPFGRRLWGLLNIELWHRQFIDGA